ncbi:hypothetical protein DdX_08544 [Ditylenchus destructor]|uniref:Uncharacterized protein n=1 Tax=Ditylenchus destructor TaxID=166010 RepID=A0AAD4N5L7_9BILA|nr:hypothetical protein DdX_08544 [Ditylenchus destructor]
MQKSASEESKKDPIDQTKIFVRDLVHSDKDWFLKEFVDCFTNAYSTKHIYVRSRDPNIPERRLLKSFDEKRDWLLSTAHDIYFQDYVVSPKPGYEGLVIMYDDNGSIQPVGAVLIRLLYDDDEKTIYLGLAIVSINMQGRGFSYYVIDKILPDRYPEYKRYEALIRYENDIPFHLFETKLPVQQDTDFTQDLTEKTVSDDTKELDINSKKDPVDLNKVTGRDLKHEDEAWFLREFVDSFMNYYKN